MNISKVTVFELIVEILLLVPLFYFARVVNDLFLTLIYLIFYVAFVCVLRYVVRKSGSEVYKPPIERGRGVNTLTTEGRIMIAVAFGFFFAGILLVIVTELIGPMPTYLRIPFFAILWAVGTLITDIIRTVLQKRANKPAFNA
jgi:hypothetical protein